MIRNLPLSVVRRWTPTFDRWCPQSVDILCPHCGLMTDLVLEQAQFDSIRDTISASATCKACHAVSQFWVVEPGDAKDSTQRDCRLLCIFHSARPLRKPIIALETLGHPALGRGYLSALKAYNMDQWTSCATECRNALEDLTKSFLPNAIPKIRLYDDLKQIPKKLNLATPFLTLLESLRKGGKLSAHFDLENQPDQRVAELMLDLVEYVIEYTYVLTDKAQILKKKIDDLENDAK